MGPRPPDFDEDLVRQAPTFVRWQKLPPGQKLRYACRDFVKGQGDDEERLMRRIMIARRNNLRDHAILKRARSKTDPTGTRTGEDSHSHSHSHSPSMAMEMETLHSIAPVKAVKVKVIKDETLTPPPPLKKKRGNAYVMTDEEVMREMDIPAVEATRSFKSWLDLEDGEEFTYNQKYIKGREGHGWLLKKNIWRRMRYRRENKKMVEKMKGDPAVADAALALTLTLTDATSNDDALALGGMLNEYEASIVSSIPEEPVVDVDVDVDVDMNINIAKNSFKSSVEVVAASAARHIVDHALPSNLLADAADVNGNINGIPEHSGGSDHDNLHDAVVEAAVAAAESYVKQARENETSDMNNMGNHHHLVTHHQHVHATMDGNSHHSGIAVDASGLSVHNPIMTLPPTTSISGDGMDVDEHHHHHTPNPLIGFEDAMDIAAKLAAAASAAGTMSSASGNFHDDDDDDGGADGEQTEDLGEDRNEDDVDVDVDIGDNKGYVDDDDDDDDDDDYIPV